MDEELRNPNLLSIGNFAAACQLSIKALRLYAQLGVLMPHTVDQWTSYRYYHADQLATARLIRLLRQIDMPLATIRQVLAASPAEAELLVHQFMRSLEMQVQQARLAVPSILQALHKEQAVSISVEVRDLAAQPMVSIVKHTKVDQLDNAIGTSIAKLGDYLAQHNVVPNGAPFGIFHGAINHQDDGPIEICMPTNQLLTATDGISVRELPPTKAAVAVMRGDECEFPKILQGYDASSDWISANGYEQADAPREIWVSPPGPNAVMEIVWPFREKA